MKHFFFLSVIFILVSVQSTFGQSESDHTTLPNTMVAPSELINPVSAKITIEGDDADDFHINPVNPKSIHTNTGLSVQAAPANNNCTNAIGLVVDDLCISGSTKESNTQTGEAYACQGTPNQSVWYKFQATSTNMFVEVERTASSGCYLSSAVYDGGCLPASNTALSCEDAAYGPNLNVHNLTNLIVNNTYLIQVAYKKGSLCGSTNNVNSGADFCIRVGNSQICNTCNNTCGAVCIFASQPTVSQVLSGCTQYTLKPRINAGESKKQCYTFTAVAANFSLQMIINSTGCSGGNVSVFNWELYNSSCGSPIQSGTLSNLNATGLSIGAHYTLCYEWTAVCQHNSVYPYIVATSPLPISLLYFSGKQVEQKVNLNWMTSSETNNEYFSVQRSQNGSDFTELARIPGAGNSNSMLKYEFIDNMPFPDINYYRIVQYDFDNNYSESKIIAIRFDSNSHFQLVQNPVESNVEIIAYSEKETSAKFEFLNEQGQVIFTEIKILKPGKQKISIPVEKLSKGTYFLKIDHSSGNKWLRIIKL